MTATMTAAYGRKYMTKEEVIQDYDRGMDFKYTDLSVRYNGTYCSCRDYANKEVRLKYGAHNEHTINHTWRK